MCGTINPFNVRGLPCALKPHFSKAANRKVLGSCSQHGCQSSFLDWVKNFRRDASDIEKEELLMCPMLWCRNTFKDADATVNHVFGCPSLSNGWYWCPYCKRPERFLECDKRCDIVFKPRLQKREANLAVTFFEWLGRRRPLKKLVDAPGKIKLEDTARDTRTRSNVRQGSSHAQKWKTRADAAHAGWMNGKAKYPGERLGAAEIAGGDVSRSELLSSQRAFVRSLHEMCGSIPFDKSEESSDGLNCRKPGPEIPMTPPLNEMFDTSIPTNLELPTVDPVYWTAELGDRASFNIPEACTAISPTTSHGLQADSSHGQNPRGADTLGKSFTKASQTLDEQCSRSPFDDSFGENAEFHSSTLSLGHDFPVPLIASPSTPSRSLISQLSSTQSQSSRASALIYPMSNVGPPTSLNRQVPGVSAIANIEDANDTWRLQSSPLPPPKPKETHLQGHVAKLRAKALTASDPSRYPWYLSRECQQTPSQSQNLGAEANYNHGRHLGGNPAQIRTQVEELRELVCIVSNEWMRGLVRSPELDIRCSSLSTRTLFAKGINTLKYWFSGKLERTFEEVFSFMHIAFAAAFILHHEDESYCWEAFFEDALQLQHALVDKKEKLQFLTAMDRWWWLPDQQNLSSNASPHSPSIRSTYQELSIGSDQGALLQDLRDSEVFRGCAGFLDGKSTAETIIKAPLTLVLGIEEAAIMETNLLCPGAAVAARTNLPRIGELVEKIIRPLEQRKGIEAYHANLADARFGVSGGILRNIREVEVMLVSTGRWSSQSAEVFERFQNCLTTQCNAANGSSDQMWRDKYYIADLNDIMDISRELEWDQRLDFASHHWRDTSVLAVIRPSGVSLESPTSLSSRSTGAFTVDSSQTSLTTPTSMDTPQEEEVSTQIASPTTASQASISPTSSAFNASTSHVKVCPMCGEKFSGTQSDAKSNLNRHMGTSSKHNKEACIKCPEPYCNANPMRGDNLGSHLQRKHGLTSPHEIKQAIKKSRGLSTVPETA